MRHLPLPILVAILGLEPAWIVASDFDVIVNEIHYNPLSGVDRDEYVELFNRGPSAVNLGGWRFTEGIDLTIPAGTILQSKELIVVSPDAAYAITKYGLPRAIGNYTGKLDNDGEIVALANASGDVVSRVHYNDDGPWPGRADGLGPSLELLDPHNMPDVGRSWASSLFVGGTPGAPNSRSGAGTASSRVIVGAQELWRYFKGTQDASTPRAAWTGAGFDDSAWLAGAGGFGFGSQPFETELLDMQNGYSSLYVRNRFTLDASELSDIQGGDVGLSLTVRYDDGFVAYLNGVEVGRGNAVNAGAPPAFNATADSALSGQALIGLGAFAGSLVAGTNVIAVQGLNNQIAGADFFLEVELRAASRPPSTSEARASISVNEVKPAEGDAGFIELHNSSDIAVTLGQHVLLDSAGHTFSLPTNTSVPPRARVAFPDSQLGFSPALAGATYVLAKKPQGSTRAEFIDALKTHTPPAGSTHLSFGRVPDGDDDDYLMASPSQGTANSVQLSGDIVVNEILFHPVFVPPGAGCDRNCSDEHQWLELHNRGASAVDIAGWSFSKGIDLAIPRTPAIPIPSGGFLVIASSKATFLADHPGFDASKVVGDWTRNLAHGSDTIHLNDALGNRVDRVEYGDGGPRNDAEPEDGIDDRTFLGTEWPTTADGTGRSIELIHPRLDNSDGAAWAAGPIGGTPGLANQAFAATPFAVIGDVESSPAVPLPTDSVQVQCRVSATQTISAVEAVWHREGTAGTNTVALRDDGLSGDGAASDGVYGGSIPAQPDQSVIAFQVRARLADGKITTLPRAPAVPPYGGAAGPFYLYQVLSARAPLNPSESYYVVMASADLAELRSRPVGSNVLLPCTFIHVARDGKTTTRHVAGIRYRGAATRQETRKPYRIDFPSEHPFEGIRHLNLNSAQIEHELLVSDLFRRAGMPYPREWAVNLTFQGSLDPRYIVKEHLDEDFLTRFLGGASDSGNLYRALDPDGASLEGDLSYLGPDPEDYVAYYNKHSNKDANDYSDVIELCRAFDRTLTPDDVFPDVIETLIDTNQWARYMAIQACLSNTDGSIQTNSGEDYYLYKVPVSSKRSDAGRWILVPWDIEETFASATEPLFRPQVPSIHRFLTHPRFAPLYYANLINLRDGAYSRFETRQRFVLIDYLFAFGTIDAIDSFITARIGFIDSNVPIELSAGALSTIVGASYIAPGETWKYWKGTQAPAGAALAWTQRAYAETGWLSGASGFGYADNDDATTLPDMENGYSSLYARKSFAISDPATVRTLDLVIDYDDGFVAYLNGAEVARRNVAGQVGDPVAFDGLAQQSHEAGTAETIPLNSFLGRLVAGDNVLAIQGLNSTIDSTDFSLIPALEGEGGPSGGIGCGTVLYSTTDTVSLSGRANAYLTGSVRVNGSAAAYDSYRAVWSATVSLSANDNEVLVEAYEGPNGTGNRIEARTLIVRRLTRPPTNVSGTLNGSTRWTAAGGPYLMTGNVTIPAGSRLDIDPGTLVIGEAGASIIVRGQIQAIGTAESPVLFRALSCSDRWGGIAVDGTGIDAASPTSTLLYCDLEFGGDAAGFTGCVSPVQSKILVDHCSFRFLTANAVNGTNARVEVRNSLFEKINEGVHCNSSIVVILDSTFRGMVGDKDGIDFDLNGPGERSRIERCLIEDGSDDGIDLQETTVDIRDNVIRNVSDKAMSLETDGPLGAPTITGNLVYDCGTGIALKSGLHLAEGFHNTLVGNQEGLNLFAKAGASDGGHAALHSMIIWSNIVDVKLDALSDVSFRYSNISSGVFPGTGNISSDPKFVSIPQHNYALKAGSPSIGTGLDASDMGAIPFTAGSPTFVRADVDNSGAIDVTDVIFTLNYLFRSGASPACLDAADSNDDASIDISDPVFLLFYLFIGGQSPPAPFPAPGVDPTSDGLSCDA